MEDLEQVDGSYDVEKVWFIATGKRCEVFEGTDKQSCDRVTLRYYRKTIPKLNYEQWCQTLMITSHVEVYPFFLMNLHHHIGDPNITLEKKIQIMLSISTKLKYFHDQGKIHGNIHSKNILIPPDLLDLTKIQFIDSLRDGNQKNDYSSPEVQQNINDPAIDVFSLGLTFLQLVDLREVKEILNIQEPPYLQPLFPQQDVFEKVQDPKIKNLLRQMLNRNYKERITMSNVIAVLQSIKAKNGNDLQMNQIHDYFQVKFSLLEEEKEVEDNKIQNKPMHNSNKTQNLFKSGKQLQKVTFSKSTFNFEYRINENELKIEWQHPAGALLDVVYKHNQLPQEIREKMDLKMIVLTLYHTPEERFQFYMNGELRVKISNEYNAMHFPIAN